MSVPEDYEAGLRSDISAQYSLNVGPIVSVHDTKYELHYDDKVKKVIGHYQMGDVIGEGNFGKVREAIDTRTKKSVAIKVLNLKRLRKMRNGEENVHREIAIMRRLDHVNVARFIELIEISEKQKMYIVLELIGGGSLRTLLECIPDGRLSSNDCRWFFTQLIDGLKYIHAQNVIHRDIKPSNLMITTKGVLKIADFGVAEVLSENKNDFISPHNMGTPSFLSPEVASGERCVSGTKNDIWAVGATLYVMACGQVPFVGRTLYGLLQNISKGQYEVPDDIEPSLSNLITGLLQPDVEKRLSLQDIMTHEWLRQAPSKVQPPAILIEKMADAEATSLARAKCLSSTPSSSTSADTSRQINAKSSNAFNCLIL